MQSSDETPRVGDEIFRRLVESVRDYAIFTLSPDGRIASWNRGAELIKQYRADEAVGRHFSLFYEPAAITAGWPEEELRRALRDGRFEDEGWRLRKDGSRFWANVVISALLDGSGRLLGHLKVTRDLTERRTQEARLKESEEQLRLIVDGVKDHAMFLADPAGRVMSWNPATQRLLGYEAGEVIGRDAAILHPPDERDAGRPQAEMSAAAHAGFFHGEGWKVKADGSRLWADTTMTAVHDAEGLPRGFVHIVRDPDRAAPHRGARSRGAAHPRVHRDALARASQPAGGDPQRGEPATTGYGLRSDREASARAGFDAHLVKPVDHEEILRLIA